MDSRQGPSPARSLDSQGEEALLTLLNLAYDSGKHLKITKLVKMLYLMDFVVGQEGKPPVTGIEWVKYHHGPYNHGIRDTIDRWVDDDVIGRRVAWSDQGGEVYEYFPKQKVPNAPNPVLMTAAMIVINLCLGMNTTVICDVAYSTAPMINIQNPESDATLDTCLPQPSGDGLTELVMTATLHNHQDSNSLNDSYLKETDIGMEEQMAILGYARSVVGNLEVDYGRSVSVKMQSHLLHLIESLSDEKTVFPYIEIDDDDSVLIYWRGGKWSINLELEEDFGSESGFTHSYSIRNDDGDHLPSKIIERRSGLGHLPLERLRDEIADFSSIVNMKNPTWRTLFA